MFNGTPVWRKRWAVHCIYALLLQEGLCRMCCICPSIVMLVHLKLLVPMQIRDHNRLCKFDASLRIDRFPNTQRCVMVKTDGAPHMDTAAAESVVQLDDAVVYETFSTHSLHPHSAVTMVQVEAAFIGEHYCLSLESGNREMLPCPCQAALTTLGVKSNPTWGRGWICLPPGVGVGQLWQTHAHICLASPLLLWVLFGIDFRD